MYAVEQHVLSAAAGAVVRRTGTIEVG